MGDGWILKNRVARGLTLFGHEPTRALLSLPWAIAHLITPDSFVGVHLLFIAVLWAKGVAMFAIIRRLPGANDGIALLTGALLIVHPASTWTIALDAPLDRHWAVLFLLVSVVCLLEIRRRNRWPWIAAMWAAQVVSLWTNEAILPSALAVPGLALWMHRDEHGHAWRSVLWWLPVPILNAVHNILHHVGFALDAQWSHGASRAVSVLATDDGVAAMLASVGVAYRKHLVDCWARAVAYAPDNWSSGAAAFIAAIALLATVVLLWRDADPADPRLGRFLLVAGLVVLGLGFAPFVPTSLRDTDGRSFIVSSVGATLAVVGAVQIVAGRKPWSRAVAVSLLGIAVGLGTSSLLGQRERYDRSSDAESALLRSIVEQAPRPDRGTVIAIEFRRPPGRFFKQNGFWPRANVFENALRYLYDDQSLHACLIFPHRASRAALTPDGVEIRRSRHGGTTRYGYDRVLAFDGGLGGRATLERSVPRPAGDTTPSAYNPQAIIVDADTLPARYRATFGPAIP